MDFNPKVVELTKDELCLRLQGLEQRYGISSADFLLQFNRGELGDSPDFIDWAGLLAAAARSGVTPPVRA